MAATDLGSALASLMQVPGLQELLNQSITQQRQLAPVRTAATQQVLNTMPSSAFGAGGRPNVSAIPAANFPTPAPAAGGFNWSSLLPYLMAGAGGAGILSRLFGNRNGGSGGSSGGNMVDLMRSLFGGHGNLATNFNNPGAVTGNYNPGDYTGINPETGEPYPPSFPNPGGPDTGFYGGELPGYSSGPDPLNTGADDGGGYW